MAENLDACPRNVSESTQARKAYGTFLYAFGYVFILSCYAMFIWAKKSRRFARLENRHVLLTHAMCIGALIHLQLDPLALMIGRENYKCGAVVLQIIMIPLIGGPILARLLSFYFRSRFESQAISTYRTATSTRIRTMDKRSDLEDDTNRRLSVQGIVHAFVYGFREAFIFCEMSERTLTLRTLRFLQSGHGISFLIFVVLLAPAVLASIIILATEPTIVAGCEGCSVPTSASSFLIAQGTLIAIMTIALLAKIRSEGIHDRVS